MPDDLTAALDVVPVALHRYRGANLGGPAGAPAFGGELLAQMAVAAARDDGRAKAVQSVHGLFLRTVQTGEPVEITVDPLNHGRSFAGAGVSVEQAGRRCAQGLVLLSAPDDDLIRHGAPMPEVDAPEACPPAGQPLPGREVRSASGVTFADPDAVGPATLAVWVRFPGQTEDPILQQGLLVHSSAAFVIGAALRPHLGFGASMAHRSFSSGIISHTVSFHEGFDPAQWLLLVVDSPYAGRGRAFGTGRIFTESGQLVGSFSQEAIVRRLTEGSGAQPAAGRARL